jgi:uncharacterized protein YdhG (YjbR/CyaY superfamily)
MAAGSVDEYLDGVADEPRKALENLRQTIQRADPEATEAISYQMPTFKHRGKSLVAYAAFKNHCSLFPMSMRVIETCEKELQPYHSSKGTIQFTADKPLPETLVEKIVHARIAEIEAKP